MFGIPDFRSMGIACAVGVMAGSIGVWHYRDLVDNSRALKEVKVQVKAEHKEAAVTNTSEVRAVQTQIKIREHYNDIIKEVPIYIVRDNPVLSNSFVGLHDIASRGEDSNPGPSSQFDDNPSDVKSDQALTTIIENYQTCYAIRANYLALQEWIKKEQSIGK